MPQSPMSSPHFIHCIAAAAFRRTTTINVQITQEVRMKSGKGTITAIAAAALFAATAADAAGNWNGPYWGANAGYAWGKSDVSTTTVFSPTGYFAASSVPAIATASGGHINADGFNGGFNLGHNQQSGNMVYGAEIDLNAMDINDSRTGGATYPCCAPTSFSNRQTVKADWLLTARGRLGYAA
ncbi:MAG: outer membrane protein, partial [Betaproteobacteria bacterium]